MQQQIQQDEGDKNKISSSSSVEGEGFEMAEHGYNIER
jgi:hypothetical protein